VTHDDEGDNDMLKSICFDLGVEDVTMMTGKATLSLTPNVRVKIRVRVRVIITFIDRNPKSNSNPQSKPNSNPTGEEVNAYDAYLVFLNGLIVGVHTKPKQITEKGKVLTQTLLS
jgi:hypothetical protein